MSIADTTPDPARTALQDPIQFHRLPAYAQFLLDNKLEEFSAFLLRTSRELKIPLLRYFDALPEEQMVKLSLDGNTKLLTALAQNTVPAYLAESLRSWKENQLPLIQGDDIVIEDISKVNFVRRKAFRTFLTTYSTDPNTYVDLMQEVDAFTLIQEESSYKTLFELKERKIREHHHFLDKINNASPGIIYVFDLINQKQVYANHKQEEMLGYTDDEMASMSGELMVDLLHPNDLPRVSQHYTDFANAAEGEMRTIEFRVRHKDGSYHWQRGYETVFRRTDTGVPCEVIGIAMDVSKEKEASIQLAQREAQLREAQELAGMGSFDWDLEGNRSAYSDQLFRILGMVERRDFAEFLNCVHPADQQMVRDAIDRAIQGHELYECEYRYRNNGSSKVLWSRGKVIYREGKAVRLQGTVMDVTQRQDMIKRLERSEQLHKQAQALTHIGNWSWSIPDNHVEWSDEMYRIFNLEPQSESMTLGRILSLIHPDDRAASYDALHRAVATAYTEDYTIRVLNPEGPVKYIAGKTEVLLDEAGKPCKITGTCQDITRQYLLHEQIRENEEASSQLINNAPEAIVVIDEESRIQLWNPKAETTFGWRFEEIKGRTLMETIIPQALMQQHSAGIRRLQDTGITRVLNKTVEVTALKKDGTSFYIALTISRSVRAGKPVFIAFIRDISNEKETELKLKEQGSQLAQKNLELERNNNELMAFNYIASHDLQEPVRKIQIFTNLLLANHTEPLSGLAKDYLERISSSATHMHGLISALIAFSRTSAIESTFERTDLNAILNEVLGLLRDKINEQGAVITTATLPVLQAIPFQIKQLFENIISNALKYSKRDVSPRIDISVELLTGDKLEDEGADPAMDYYRISIADNGIGFDQQYAEKVFELFQRLHNRKDYTGTGIGLAICKKIVQNHAGFITARSSVGRGSTFSIYLLAHVSTGKAPGL